MNKIVVEVSVGELLDKISILEIKKEKINDPEKLRFINNEHDGILLDNNIDDWIDKISFLLDNSEVRERLLLNALKRSEDSFNAF